MSNTDCSVPPPPRDSNLWNYVHVFRSIRPKNIVT
ncbi:hypothetical protein EMEDMD4_350016 [Sinorhizobium medicae]|uniref:Uncharacterized protein n=1 Tax=Sinorhizobium medicae TaxID=110321 RepID=A0A508WY74_9HYPH|nr:hypothetical protein EMEDMD4_350016 [Sinorhizobium medicae]